MFWIMGKRSWMRNEAQGTVAQCLPREPQYVHLGLLVQAPFCSRVATPRVALSLSCYIKTTTPREAQHGQGTTGCPTQSKKWLKGRQGGNRARNEAAFKNWQWKEGRKDRTQSWKAEVGIGSQAGVRARAGCSSTLRRPGPPLHLPCAECWGSAGTELPGQSFSLPRDWGLPCAAAGSRRAGGG